MNLETTNLLLGLGMVPGMGYFGIPMMYWVIFGGTALASMLVSGVMRSRFAEFSRTPVPFTGAQVAEMMLRQNGINDVKVVSVPGQLTDHYDPTTKTVNLSEPVYASNSVAAAAVAAHECGHAVQHQQAYLWLGLRSTMVPAVQISSQLLSFLLPLGFICISLFRTPLLLWGAVALFGVTTLFSIITLPVEFDASRRALAWLGNSRLGAQIEQRQARSALFWAAMTYVVAAIGSVAQLVYFFLLASGSRRD